MTGALRADYVMRIHDRALLRPAQNFFTRGSVSSGANGLTRGMWEAGL